MIAGILYFLYSFQLQRKLALAENRRLQELERFKARLYTNITHEFRTPLTLYQYVRVSSDNPEFEKAMWHVGIQHSSGKMAMTAYVGSRFALSGHSSVFMELGYGVSLLKVGVGYKL